jgi:hypothetical protein
MSIEGAFFFAVFAILILGGAYTMWPAGFFSNSFADMSMGTVIRAAASLVLAMIGLEFLGALAIVVLSDS